MKEDAIICLLAGVALLSVLALAEGAYYLGKWLLDRYRWMRWWSL